MSEKYSGEQSHTMRNVAIAAVAMGQAMGFGDGIRTVVHDHREKTHHSVKTHPRLRQAFNFMGRSLAQKDSRLWPDAHLDHHAFSDVRLFPFLERSRAINWVEQQMKDGNDVDVEIPADFGHLDPKVEKYTLAQVKEIGGLAEEYVKEKLGDHYVPPAGYTKEALHKIFHPEEPDYHYKPYKKKRRGEYTSDEMAELVLGDPHSPLYADKTEKNGVKKILQKGLWPYLTRTNLSKVYPEIISPHAQLPEGEEIKNVWPAVVTGVLTPGLAVLIARGKYESKDFAYAAAASVIATGTRVAFVGAGSMAVNSYGHSGGEVTPKAMRHAAISGEYDIKLKPKGKVATNYRPRGVVGWLVNFATSDEVFNQEYHHDHPDARKYSASKGLEGIIEAPMGTVIDAIARSRVRLLEPGDNFGRQSGERRPDEPHPALLLVEARRDKQYRLDLAKAGEEKQPRNRKRWVLFQGRKSR